MKKAIVVLCLSAFMATLVVGCAATYSNPFLMGGIYTQYKGPVAATGEAMGAKMGTATASSILGWFAMGDASIATAAKNGGITKISHVDFENMSILGLYSTYKVVVYGE